MTGEKFTLMQYSISAILGLIEAEDFVIPEIQRPFVWKRSQVEAKLSSWRIRHLARPYRNVSVCLLCCIAVILRAFFVI